MLSAGAARALASLLSEAVVEKPPVVLPMMCHIVAVDCALCPMAIAARAPALKDKTYV
jgi:hypothetical protein